MRAAKLGSKHSELAKLKIKAGNAQAQTVIVTDNKTGESKEFTFIRKVAKFVGIHYSYVGKIYTITKK
jgi:hypothetical protein